MSDKVSEEIHQKEEVPKKRFRIKHHSAADAISLIMRLIQNYPNYIRDISDFQFDRPIGKGGFGQVWLARDLRTGRLCAIKELHSDNLTGRNMSSFVREINTMIKVNERFVLPFIGYTIDPPYSIISEYIPNGNLYSYINITRRKQTLSGTHLTIIALGIAWGMIHMHRMHILHRDLKSTNILLDTNYLPVICDFGVSRYEAKSGKMTSRIGTITHMAPEVVFSKYYGLSCDVYSFAFVLYEMSQGHNPYKGTLEEIFGQIREKIKPQFVEKTPDCLKDLITQAWEDDPTKRPTFTEIFQMFKSGQVHFKGADINTVKNFAEELERVEEERKASKKKLGDEPTKSSLDTEAILERLQRQYDRQKAIEDKEELEREKRRDSRGMPLADGENAISNELDENENINQNQDKTAVPSENSASLYVESEENVKLNPSVILRDSSNSQFIATMDYLTKNITLKQFNAFYLLLYPHFRDAEDYESLRLIMTKFIELIDRDNKFINCFEKEHFFTALPLNTEETLNLSFIFVSKIFKLAPKLVSHTLFRALGSFLLKIPDKALSLFALYATKFNETDEPFQVFDFMIMYARQFVSLPCGSKFIDILYYLITYHPDYRKLRLMKIKPILYVFSSSKCRVVARAAVCALANLYDETFETPFNAMCRNILDTGLEKPTISVLLRTNKYPVSRVFCRVMVNALPKSGNILLKFADQSVETAKIVAMNTRWMSCFDHRVYQLFLMLFAHKELRLILEKSPLLPSFLAEFANSNDNLIIISLSSVLKRITLNQSVIEKLSFSKLFRNLSATVTRAEDSAVKSAVNSFLDAVARKGYSSEFQLFIPYLMNLLPMRTNNTTEAIAVLVTFSCHKHIAQIFKKSDLVNYFKSLQSTQSYKKQADLFISNIDRI